MKRRCVYFIKPIGMPGPVKIGHSAAPSARRGSLERWSPFPLEIAAQIDGGEQLERRFHSKFADSFQGREWFLWSPELQDVIDAINAGTFDTSTLPEGRVLRSPKGYDSSYLTPAYRYRHSVMLRLRHRGSSNHDDALKRILAVDRIWDATPEHYLAHRAEIDAWLAELPVRRAA